MKKKDYILDPHWVISGTSGIDSEYLKYILLSADKKWREKLKEKDFSSFFEIVFHMLNLNNLAVEGSIFDFKMRPTWDTDNLKEIREKLRNVYKNPDEITEIFKNSNNIFVKVVQDHLELILDVINKCHIYYTNENIHKEKEIFIILNKYKNKTYDVWRLRFDRRFQLSWNIKKERDIKVTKLKDNIIEEAIKDINDPILNRMIPKKNVILSIAEHEFVEERYAESIAFSIIFSRMIVNHINFHPNILFELHELLVYEKILPFTLKLWI